MKIQLLSKPPFKYLLVFFITCSSCDKSNSQNKKSDTEKIIEEYVYNCADTYNYKYQHHQYQECLVKKTLPLLTSGSKKPGRILKPPNMKWVFNT